MNSPKAIGGYFELELPAAGHFMHDNATALLSSGRACFEMILRSKKPRRVLLPKYTCDVMLEPTANTGTPYEFYSINQDLELINPPVLDDDDLLVYTNYFGVKNEYAKVLAKRYGNKLILDCSQAFYMEPSSDAHTFYSPRKFFGLPDGGMVYTDSISLDGLERDQSYNRSTHLLQRVDIGAEAGYENFKLNDATLSGEPIKTMSNLTRRLLSSINYEAIKDIRESNYTILHKSLKSKNKLLVSDKPSGPMAYPFMSDHRLRQKLIDARIYVPTYWPNVLEWTKPEETEHLLAKEILPLPIDQRYGTEDMERILGFIYE